MAVELDDVDVKLLTELQQDADRTNVELAELVGLSPAATLHRVRRLKETGVIRLVTARVDPAAAGLPLTLFVAVTLAAHDERSAGRFERELHALPQVVQADLVAGEMDYWLTVVAADVPDLTRILTRLATVGGQRVVSHLRLQEVKLPAALPVTTTPPAPRRRPRR